MASTILETSVSEILLALPKAEGHGENLQSQKKSTKEMPLSAELVGYQ